MSHKLMHWNTNKKNSTDFIGGYSRLTPSGLTHQRKFMTPLVQKTMARDKPKK